MCQSSVARRGVIGLCVRIYIAVAIRPAAGRDLIALFVRHFLFALKYTEISVFNMFSIQFDSPSPEVWCGGCCWPPYSCLLSIMTRA